MRTISNPTDACALDALLRHWFVRVGGRTDTIDTASEPAYYAVDPNLELQGEGRECLSPGFHAGFNLAIRAAAAVLSDPLGNPGPKLTEAVKKARAEIKAYLRDREADLEMGRKQRENAA